MNYRFHPAARVEHLEHVRYYQEIRPGLGARYLGDFAATMSRICENPHRYRLEREPNIRAKRFMMFPYSVIFREVERGVQVLAVPHDRQRPGLWFPRL